MPENVITISGDDWNLDTVKKILYDRVHLELDSGSLRRVRENRKVIDDIVASDRVVYGVNTGFGKFSDVRIKKTETAELQRRLVLSHAAGVGTALDPNVVHLMMALKIKNLSRGYSGIRPETLALLTELYNRGIIPVVPEQGSVGASGDLAPLAHMTLPLIGKGEVFIQSITGYQQMVSMIALKTMGLEPIVLAAKEGLALLNGTQAMQAVGLSTLLRAENLVRSADIIGAMSLEGLLGSLTPFDPRIQTVRRHKGQVKVAANVRTILENSPIVDSHKHSHHRVQDAYCLRCIPQVHGAIRDGFDYVSSVFENEMNGVTDNPLIFTEDKDVLSGGNFHGEPVALAADYLGILLAELANISERRIEHMMDGSLSEMQGFLIEEGGLNSGFMIAQVTAAALVSENKVLAHPASVDSIPTSANKEDHVSMGMHAARKARDIAGNTEKVLAVELICACQAFDLRAPLVPSPVTGAILKRVREEIEYWDKDRLMYKDLEKARQLVHSGELVKIVREETGDKLV